MPAQAKAKQQSSKTLLSAHLPVRGLAGAQPDGVENVIR